MPEFEDGETGETMGGAAIGGRQIGEQALEPGVGSVDAVQDDPGSDGDAAEELAAENEALRARVVELESALAGVERRFELERALMDAGVIDLETALAVAATRVDSELGPAAVVSELLATKPFLFRVTRPSVRGSASGGSSSGSASSLTSLAEEARTTGDRRALTRYLRRRRQG
jgi:hypothetical protein